MKLLITAQPASGGVAVCVSQQVRAAVEHDHEVVVACPPSHRGPLADWVTAAGARHVGLDMSRSPGPRDVSHALALRRLMSQADVVHAHSSKAGALSRLAALTMRQRPPVIFTPHAWSWLVGGRMSHLYLMVERSLAPVTDVFVAVGEREASEGKAALAKNGMTVVPNGVDVDHWAPEGPVAPRGPQKLIVCVGRLSVQKGQDLAIRALARLGDERAVLRLLGDGPAEAELRSLAAELGLRERVEFWGPVDHPDQHLRAADVVVVPSRWDGMSLALLEAMAVGCAIVASDVAGSEVLGDAAVVVPPGDVASLANAIDALFEDDDWRRRLAADARQKSLSHSLETTLSSMLSVWEDTFANSARRGMKRRLLQLPPPRGQR